MIAPRRISAVALAAALASTACRRAEPPAVHSAATAAAAVPVAPGAVPLALAAAPAAPASAPATAAARAVLDDPPTAADLAEFGRKVPK